MVSQEGLIKHFMRRWARKYGKTATEVEGDFKPGVYVKPTQANKPSASSHFNLYDLYYNLRKRFPSTQGYSISLVANTNSMEPGIDDNTVVISSDLTTELGLKHLDDHPLRVGDVCTYFGDPEVWGFSPSGKKKRIIHRIIKIRRARNGKMFYTFKGDNNFFADPGEISLGDFASRNFIFAQAEQKRKGD